MRCRARNSGFSLVELTTAMAVSLMLVFSFSSVVVMSRKQLTETSIRVGLGFDQVLIDKYVRSMLTSTISDSMRIYADADAEAGLVTSSNGSILRAVNADSTVYHIEYTDSTLLWMIDSTRHTPVDCKISGLNFTEHSGALGKSLAINLKLCTETDTLACAWFISLRN